VQSRTGSPVPSIRASNADFDEPAFEKFVLRTFLEGVHKTRVHSCKKKKKKSISYETSVSTAPASVCVHAVVGALAVWIQNQKKICLA